MHMANDTYDRETDDADDITIRIEGEGHGDNRFVRNPDPNPSRFEIWDDPEPGKTSGDGCAGGSTCSCRSWEVYWLPEPSAPETDARHGEFATPETDARHGEFATRFSGCSPRH